MKVLLKASTEGEASSFVHGVITADVVHSNVPMLLSRVALKRMAAQLNFDTNGLTIQNKYRIRLKEMENGHLALPYIRNEGGNPVNRSDHGVQFRSQQRREDLPGSLYSRG